MKKQIHRPLKNGKGNFIISCIIKNVHGPPMDKKNAAMPRLEIYPVLSVIKSIFNPAGNGQTAISDLPNFIT